MKEDEPSTNKFKDTTGSTGFFKGYFNNFKSTVTKEQMTAFAAITTDEERVLFVSKLLPDCKEVVPEVNFGKDAALASKMKEKGNAEFVRGDTTRALSSYTSAILNTPFNSGTNSDIAVALANRSAAQYHLEQFEDAIQDIDMALSFSYPKELCYKIQERKAKCLLALKRHDEALATFRKTLQSLDDSKLATEKKMKMQNDIQIMLNLLTKQKTKQGHVNALVEGAKLKKKEIQVPTVTGKRRSTHPAISEMVVIQEADEVGRYAAAATDIAVGATVVVEKAYCSVLLREHSSTHCIHCFKRTSSPYPCSGCSSAVFCGPSCQEASQASYHHYECSISNALYSSGASVMVLMALRIISQQSLQYFLGLKKSLQEPRESLKTYKSGDYLPVYHLVRHENQRNIEDFFERTVMAVFLLRALQGTGYFGDKATATGQPLAGEESFIGGLLLRHLQLLQFNAHEMSELETDCTESVDKSTSVFLGGGLFPTLALFNHSCDPAVVRYFVGTNVVVRTVRPVSKGELVAENYGPIFTVKPRSERQRTLRSQYWFDCGCQPCEEDWPLLSSMDRSVIRFRCDGGDDIRCSGVIQVPLNTEEFMLKCPACGRHTNLLKGLKILQDTDAMFRQASMDTDRGMEQNALDIYLEILTLLHRHLAPPFYDYHLCQQAIRKCMLSLGNKYSTDF